MTPRPGAIYLDGEGDYFRLYRVVEYGPYAGHWRGMWLAQGRGVILHPQTVEALRFVEVTDPNQDQEQHDEDEAQAGDSLPEMP